MTTKINGIGRHCNNVANAPFDVTVAAGAEVCLHGLVRLHKRGFGVGPEVDCDAFGHTYKCAGALAGRCLTSLGGCL